MSMTKRNSRFFSNRDARILYLSSDGRCAICGAPLGDDWEADHIVPFSKGGATTLENGQAVCRSCNRKKGDKMAAKQTKAFNPQQAKSIKPRSWQVRFAEKEESSHGGGTERVKKSMCIIYTLIAILKNIAQPEHLCNVLCAACATWPPWTRRPAVCVSAFCAVK